MTGNVASMGDNINFYEVSVGGPERGHWDNTEVVLKKVCMVVDLNPVERTDI
jgi:hypothetical protein